MSGALFVWVLAIEKPVGGFGALKRGGAGMAKLTPKQEAFARSIALDGMTQADAYRSVYKCSNTPDEQIYVRASEVANNSKVAVRIKELAKQAMTPKVMSAQKRREKLTELAQGDDPQVVMKAIDLLNKMDGEYVQKVEAEVKQELNINVELVDE